MALSILDGNQSATTLSTILSSGQHITAHTVVSLGTQAITDIVNATSAGLTNTQLRASAVTIAGTVTVNSSANFDVRVTQGGDPVDGNNAFPVYGTVTANGIAFNAGEATPDKAVWIAYNLNNTLEGVSDSAPLPISGTVTANSSNGSLTTRFGSVTTANTAFATSAVTNTNRKYLLIQNITTAANVITVGIGFTPTTTQGIQLFAGAGLTFEGTYIPTGSVNLLSSVTASCYTILEA